MHSMGLVVNDFAFSSLFLPFVGNWKLCSRQIWVSQCAMLYDSHSTPSRLLAFRTYKTLM